MAVFWGKFYFFSFKYYLVASRKYWFKINKNLKWTEDQCPCQEKITAKLEIHTGMWVNNQWRYLKHLENQQKQSLLFTHITQQSRFSVSGVHWADVSQRVERRQQNLLCVLIWRKTMMLLLPVLLLREVNNYCYLFTNKRTMSPKLNSQPLQVCLFSLFISPCLLCYSSGMCAGVFDWLSCYWIPHTGIQLWSAYAAESLLRVSLQSDRRWIREWLEVNSNSHPPVSACHRQNKVSAD